MKYLGQFTSDANIQSAVNSGSLSKPYVGVYEVSNRKIIDYNKKRKIYTFSALEIAPGPLYYGSNGYEITNTWNYASRNVIGKNAGSYYFSFIEMGQLFENANFTSEDGDIENLLDPLNGWRLPTRTEWNNILSTGRNGSTVNGNARKHWAFIKITNLTHAGYSPTRGLLLFPDNNVITGATLNNLNYSDNNVNVMDPDEYMNTITLAELNEYLNQGCIFLPYGSAYINSESDWIDSLIDSDLFPYGYYLSSDNNYDDTVKCAKLEPNKTNALSSIGISDYLNVRLVKQVS